MDTFQHEMQTGRVPLNPFTTLKADIRAHWAEHRPQMFAWLQASGQLEQAIETAYELTDEAVVALTSGGRGFTKRGKPCGRTVRFCPPKQISWCWGGASRRYGKCGDAGRGRVAARPTDCPSRHQARPVLK